MSALAIVPSRAAAELAARSIFRSEEGLTFIAWLLHDAGVLSRQSPLDLQNCADPCALAAQKATRDQALLILDLAGVRIQFQFLGLPEAPAARQTEADSPIGKETTDG